MISVLLLLASGVFACSWFQFKTNYQASVGENEEGGVDDPLERRTISIWPRSFVAPLLRIVSDVETGAPQRARFAPETNYCVIQYNRACSAHAADAALTHEAVAELAVPWRPESPDAALVQARQVSLCDVPLGLLPVQTGTAPAAATASL